MLHALIPVKPLDAAKTRLAAVLDARQRRDLALAMLADVLAALAGSPCVTGVTVVSRDGAALALAGAYGAGILPDSTPDLNAALAHGAHMLAANGATALLVLPADLPLLAPADIALLADNLGPAPSAVLAPARDGGTNALVVSPPTALPFLFGPGSLAAHLTAARERGVITRLLRSRGLELDVDVPDDLLELACASGGTAAQRLVRRLVLAEQAACA
jgi:2-phospho-L-lactate/phosphoenolpyruvate guanylyltransferase